MTTAQSPRERAVKAQDRWHHKNTYSLCKASVSTTTACWRMQQNQRASSRN